MYSPNTASDFWTVIAAIEKTVADRFRILNAPRETMQDALAMHCLRLETAICRSPGGNVSVTVSVKARRGSEDYADYFILQRAGNSMWMIREVA